MSLIGVAIALWYRAIQTPDAYSRGMVRPLPTGMFAAAGFLGLTAAATLFAVAVSFAQPTGGTVVGRVRDWTDGILVGVSVTLFPARGGAVTQTTADHDGRYRFDGVPAGRYRIDFNLGGFDIWRVNLVEVQPGATATADGWLRSSLCECIRVGHGSPVVAVVAPPPPPPPIQGQVVDNTGQPIPYTTLELVRAQGRETAYTDREGRFLVRASAGAWSITASDSGFEPVTMDMSGTTSGSLVFALPSVGTPDITDTERLNRRTCYCPAASFVHEQR